jgi:putative MATE family efflux protein
MNENTLESPMATKPVGKIMLTMGIPMILSMMLQALYNIVDSAFVAKIENVGEQALNAMTLAFPVQMLMVAVGIGTGVGVNAMVARLLGQNDRERASRAAGNGIFLSAVIYVVFLLFGLFGVEAYVGTQTDNAEIFSMAASYLRICCCASFGIVFFPCFEKLLQATGRSLFSTIAQVAGAVTNIVLDPILIFGLLGLPKMGVVGAALATVIGQVVSMILGIIFHLVKNKEISTGIRYIKPSAAVIGQIYSIGLPAIIAQALMSFMTYGLNIILVRIDESVVTAYGLYYKIQQFILFAAFGLRDAITPIVSFNYGMGSKKRVNDGIKYGMIYTLVIMAVGLIALEIFAEPIASAFGLSGTTCALCVGAMRVISASFIFAGANVAFQGIFQALGCGIESLIISVCRQFLFVLPVAWAFSLAAVGNIDNTWLVWLTFPIAELVTVVIALFLMKRISAKKIDALN